MLRVALSVHSLGSSAQDATLDGDRPARAYNRGGNQSGERDAVSLQSTRESDPAFSDWLGHTLHRTYDPVAWEPLPQDLAALIRHLDQSAAEPKREISGQSPD